MSTQEEDNPLHKQYFRWLYDQVVPVLDSQGLSSYWLVCTRMHDVPFKALIPHDGNRTVEGANLRTEFASSIGRGLEIEQVNVEEASVFEVLVALAKRANLMIEMTVMKWFQLFIRNLRLDLYCDWYCMSHTTGRVDKTIGRFNDRTYRYSGAGGGLFPLNRPQTDQRQVELWYQMGAYMTEHKMY